MEKIGWIKRGDKIIKTHIEEIDPIILYIQPSNPNKLQSVISFENIIDALSDETEPLTRRFLKSLGNGSHILIINYDVPNLFSPHIFFYLISTFK